MGEDLRRELEALSTEELVSILRNRDEDEWRPEVFDLVAAILEGRGVSPKDVVALGPEAVDVIEGQPLVTLGRYFSPVQAHAHRMALEDAGLQAWVSDEILGTMYGVGVGPRLQVRAEDERAARAVLEAGPPPASSLPAELAEPPCPSCGSTDVNQTADLPDPSPQAPAEGSRRVWRYECGSCGHAWSDPGQA